MEQVFSFIDLIGSYFNLLVASSVLVSILLIGMVLYMGYARFVGSATSFSWGKISDTSEDFRKIFKQTQKTVKTSVNSVNGSEGERLSHNKVRKIERAHKDSEALMNWYFQRYMGDPLTRVEISSSNINLFQFLNEIVGQCRLKTGKNPVKVYIDVDSSIFIASDPLRLASIFEDVVLRLLSNFDDRKAISYLKLTGRVVDHQVCLTISDNGLGISSEELPLVFSIYSKTSRNFKNPRMGLFIIKEYARKLNAYFKAYSEKGEGSMFIFELENACSGQKKNEPELMLT